MEPLLEGGKIPCTKSEFPFHALSPLLHEDVYPGHLICYKLNRVGPSCDGMAGEKAFNTKILNRGIGKCRGI